VGAVQIGDFKYNDGATEGFFVYCFCFCFFSSKINVFSYELRVPLPCETSFEYVYDGQDNRGHRPWSR
jgi:hypothetical protein